MLDRTLWRPIAGEFAHMCPFVGLALIDEHDDEILQCRCYWSTEFLDAQDKRAVALDAGRARSR
jgi:hypothetical protein